MEKNSFETNLSHLEQLVEKLESGEVDLNEGLKLFEEGVSVYKDCKKVLDKAEKKVFKLTEDLKKASLNNA